MSVDEFFKGLPCHNAQNFTHIRNEVRTSQSKIPIYLPTEDQPAEQLIVMERSTVLFRYLVGQSEKKWISRKRQYEDEDENETVGNYKKPHLESPMEE